MSETPVDLANYSPGNFDRGRSAVVEVLWRFVSALVFQSAIVPSYALKRVVLRAFGAKVGEGVVIKPRVSITLPWKVTLGDHVWIGEGAWLDSLAEVRIDAHACISQRAYLCTGNHDYRSRRFDLRVEPIVVGRGAWVAAGAVIGPGVTIGDGAVLGLGSVAATDLEPFVIYRGNPAVRVRDRKMRAAPDDERVDP
ncbi:MAG: WcaF family extracellular polysaccharide biosynthesis acetyltransferase [Acidobacteriota bacterium]|nr:WcaF family extracellular polysaccharide biosynthesis acetyltransferase [Acidobacteriota bacterium]